MPQLKSPTKYILFRKKNTETTKTDWHPQKQQEEKENREKEREEEVQNERKEEKEVVVSLMIETSAE